MQQHGLRKRATRQTLKEKLDIGSEHSSSEVDFKLKCLPMNYCVNITQDGFRNMDKASHLNDDQIENRLLENKLRPISGIRNHLKRNLTSAQSSQKCDIIKDTDLIQRISSVKTLKRLDLSFNNLSTFPRQLCELNLLESLIIKGNNLQENDIPVDIEKYQYLIELNLDMNALKKIPKNLCKCKRLHRLSISNNSLTSLNNLEHFKRLRFLILSHNDINYLDDSVKNLDKLELLDLSHNSISSIQNNLFKSSLANLRQLDLSFCKINNISSDIFMLNHLEILNLSHNSLSKLPMLPFNYFRTVPIFSLDLSKNQLSRFYEYLLILAKNVDLGSNKIKTLPSKALDRLSVEDISQKVLKLEGNPMVEPPNDVCNHGLKIIKQYYVDMERHIQLNKGFKIIILGDKSSGKTSLANALEDHFTQTNLIEQTSYDESTDNNQQNHQKENKLVDIREFFISNEHETVPELSSLLTIDDFKASSSNFSTSSKVMTSTDQIQSKKLISSSIKGKKKGANKINHINHYDINAFSNLNLSFSEQSSFVIEKDRSRLPVNIFDFNGSVSQYGHLFNLFLDKNALIIICLDCTIYIENNKEKIDAFENTIKYTLDIILLRMSKLNSYCILPVLTKVDKLKKLQQQLSEKEQAQVITSNFLTVHIEKLIKNYLNSRINDIKIELKQIELQDQISTSQSDRLKQLVQTQNNLTPEIYKQCLPVSSLRNSGIQKLGTTLKEIIFGNDKYFPDVNRKVPAFWIEVDKYVHTKLSEMPSVKYIDDKIKIDQTSHQNISVLCMDYDEYKERIVEKYGMRHLVEQITKYMNSNGKVIWFQDTKKLSSKVFLRPSLFYDLFFVLFRSNFEDNFNDVYIQTLRNKLNKNNLNEEAIAKLKKDFLEKGHLHLDLLKFLWSPILMSDSIQLVQEVMILFMDYFYVGYPMISKEKLKTLFTTNKFSRYGNCESSSINWNYQNPQYSSYKQSLSSPLFSIIVLPFYLPFLKDDTPIFKERYKLKNESSSAMTAAVALRIKKSKPMLLPKICQRYSFPWGLIPGIFERFATNCLINSDLYYKYHYRNYILAYNEDNTIAVLIHTNCFKSSEKCNQIVFEFYLINYDLIADGIQKSNKLEDDLFEHTLSMDLDQVWILALRVLQLFEETISTSYPSLRYDRSSMCPECEEFTFFGEWTTPKELQKLKTKICSSCKKEVDCSFLVKPSTGRPLTLDLQKMHQRLENIVRIYSSKQNNTKNSITSQTKLEFHKTSTPI